MHREQIAGLMTRQFLKALLIQLPKWLVQQQKKTEAPQQIAQQHLINAFEHQISQQQVPVT
ncbi:MAG: hypothetical protein LZF61_08990 [Nitrosomonas sp.]|nr:MAG: hypothetical protein LZF61_08990 [Nitrosomonas sp.]